MKKFLLFVLALTLIMGTGEGRRTSTKDKSELYRRYPQLSSNDTNNCVKAVNKMLVNLFEYPYNQMTMHSTHQINDLGSYTGCKSIAENPEFAVLALNISYLTFSINFGLCMPQECMQADYTQANVALTNAITNALQYIVKATQLKSDIIKPESAISLTVKKSDEVTEKMKEDTATGFILFTIIFAAFLLMLAVIPGFYHISRIQRGKCHLFPDIPEIGMQQTRHLLQSQNSRVAAMNINNSGISNDQTKISERFNMSRGESSPNMVLEVSPTSRLEDSMQVSPRALLDTSDANVSRSETQNNSNIMRRTEINNFERFKQTITNFSFISAYKTLTSTRCKEWDNRELDVIDAFKFITTVMTLILGTSFFLMGGATYNTWKLLDFFQLLFFAFVVSCNNALDVFYFLSMFLGVYKCLQIYEANDNKFGVKDALKLYARKIIRLAPLYYTVFFFGWLVGVRMNSGPIWYSYGSLFYDCGTYWWADLLFIGNLVPFFTPATSGCMYWCWAICCDAQLYLLAPIYTVLYMRWRKFGLFFPFVLLMASMAINISTVMKYNLTAGPVSVEDYYLFANVLNKPYAKFGVTALGAWSAFLYWDILKYRQTKHENQQKKFPKVHALHNKWWVGKIFILCGLALMVFILLSNHTAVKNAHSWEGWENVLYYALARNIYALGIMLVLFAMLFGHFNFGFSLLRNSYFRALGKLSFESGCIAPIIIVLMYCGQEYSLYLETLSVLYLAVGNIVSVVFTCLPIYLVVEYPFKMLVSITILPLISHDDVLKKKYLPEQYVEQSRKSVSYKVKGLE